MSESELNVTPGTGAILRMDARTIDGETRLHSYFVPGEAGVTTYSATATSVAVTTSADHVIIIQGDGTNYVRLRRLWVRPRTLTGSAGFVDLQLFRVTTAGTGGTTVSARPYDDADTDPYGGVVMTRPTAKGTEDNRMLLCGLGYPAAAPITREHEYQWDARLDSKPLITGSSTAAGFALKVITGIATLTLDVEMEFVVTSWL